MPSPLRRRPARSTVAPRIPIVALALVGVAAVAGAEPRPEAPPDRSPTAVAPSSSVGVPLPPAAILRTAIVDWATVEEQARAIVASGGGTRTLADDDGRPARGLWQVPGDRSGRDAASGVRSLANRGGDLEMRLGFPAGAAVHGLAIAGQSGEGAWPAAVRLVAERDGRVVGRTDWRVAGRATWTRLELDGVPGFEAVDRLVIEAQPGAFGLAFYAIDDLTLTDRRGPRAGVRRTVDFEDLAPESALDDALHAGVRFERGAGLRGLGGPMPPPAGAGGDDRAEPGPAAPAGAIVPVLPGPPEAAAGTIDPPVIEGELETVRRGDAGLSFFPPDSCGAVGPDHVVTVVNQVIAIHDKHTGALRSRVPLSAFLGLGAGDPRVLYDHHHGRWVVMATNFDQLVALAYSLGDDPTLAWFTTAFDIAQGVDANRWPDYPTLGVDARGIYVAAKMIGGPSRMTVVAIDKAPLLDPSPSLGAVTAFRNLPEVGAIQPTQVFHEPGGDPGRQYLVARRSATVLELMRVDPPLAAPSFASVGFASIPNHAAPPDAPALGSSTPLDTVGPRLMNAVYRDGTVYAAHAFGFAGRAALRWYEVDTSTLDVETGTLADPVRYWSFPSIAVNRFGDVALGFSGSYAGEYAGAWIAGRRADDPTGQLSPAIRYRTGDAAINTIDQFGRNRWGDYSLTVVDPDDDVGFFTFQAFAAATNTWGVSMGTFRIGDPVAPANDDCVDAQVVGSGGVAFTTAFATTDGPDESPACSPGGVPDLRADVWYRWTAPCTGIALIDACDADFDAKLAVYAACPNAPGAALACNDDFCGIGPTLFLPVAAGTEYLIRLGSRTGATGAGTLQIACDGETPPCPADVDGDGEVGFPDLVELLAGWGPCPAPPADCPADVDGDDEVGFPDLVELLAAWGPCAG